ncbi:MAG: hypothetical protein IPI74_03480 [Bacteroidales bacterium]|nr:hypothetical protein [Bacteroidales bacterium]
MGYRHGVEYRYPLLDRRIIEFMLRVPSELLCVTDYFRPLLREVGVGLLPEEVRLNTSKSDPFTVIRCQGFTGMQLWLSWGEAGRWREIQNLGFVDFDSLLNDIESYRRG